MIQNTYTVHDEKMQWGDLMTATPACRQSQETGKWYSEELLRLNYESGFSDSPRKLKLFFKQNRFFARKIPIVWDKETRLHTICNYLLCPKSVGKEWLYMVTFCSLVSGISHGNFAWQPLSSICSSQWQHTNPDIYLLPKRVGVNVVILS